MTTDPRARNVARAFTQLEALGAQIRDDRVFLSVGLPPHQRSHEDQVKAFRVCHALGRLTSVAHELLFVTIDRQGRLSGWRTSTQGTPQVRALLTQERRRGESPRGR